MSVKNWFAAATLLPGLCLATLPVLAQQQQSQASPAPQSGDPVADAARKARESESYAEAEKSLHRGRHKACNPSSGHRPAPANGGAQAAPGNGPDAANGG